MRDADSVNPPHFIDGPEDLSVAMKTVLPKHMKDVTKINVVDLKDPDVTDALAKKLGYNETDTARIKKFDGFFDPKTKQLFLNEGQTTGTLYHELGHAVFKAAPYKARRSVTEDFEGGAAMKPGGLTRHESSSVEEYVSGLFRLAYEGGSSSPALSALKKYGLWALAPLIVMPKEDKKK